MPQVKFDSEQCNIFTLDSKTHYDSPETTDPKFIQWKFMGFKSHPSHHLFISSNDSSLNDGRAALNIRTLNIRGDYKRVTQVTDLLVVKSRATLLSFIMLIKKYSSLNTEVVLHTSNENSENIYSNFFKFKEVVELSAFAFPLRPNNLIDFFKRYYLLSKIISFYSFVLFFLVSLIESINAIHFSNFVFSENEDILLSDFTEREISLLRSKDFLRWRYSDAPYVYKMHTVFSRKKPIGILVVRLAKFQGAFFYLVMDYISSGEIGCWDGLGLRLAILAEAIKENADAVFGLFNRKNKDLSTFFHFPFVAIDDKVLPHRTPIFASSLSASLSTEMLEKMYFSLGDLDYF